MKKLRIEQTQVKILCIGMVLLLLAVLIPLFWISAYNFKCADDFPFAQNAEQVWDETKSVLQVMCHQFEETWDMYQTWQGTYFDIWFSTSMMGVFVDSAYYMGTILSLGGFVVAEMLFFTLVLTKGLGADKYRAIIASCSCVIMQVLLTPYPAEGFFWFCGAIRYTFIHGLGFALLTLMFILSRRSKEITWKLILLEVGIVLLSIAIGGSNYVTALTMAILYVLGVAWMFWRKNPHKIMMLCNMFLYFLAFGVNVLSPGNGYRQISSGVEHMSVVETVLRALKEAANYCIVNLHPPVVIVGLLLIPIFWNIVKKRDFKYPVPFPVSIFAFGIFAAQFAPTLYSLQIVGAGRVQNLYRFNFYILIYGLELYWLGWLWRRVRIGNSVQQNVKASYLLPGWLVGGMILFLALSVWGGDTLTTVSAVKSLRRGEAQQYRQEYEERLLILEDPSIKEVYLEPYSVKPYLLFFYDVAYDTEDWVNKAMADYYDKDVVGLKE